MPKLSHPAAGLMPGISAAIRRLRCRSALRIILGGSLLPAAAWPATLAAQRPDYAPRLPIADAIRDDGRDYVPDRLGERLTVRGTATTWPIRAGEALFYIVVQDDHSAVRLITDSITRPLAGIKPGDRLEATGTLRQYKGSDEIAITRIERIGSGEPPEPRDVLAADLIGERHSSRLVRVTGELMRITGDSGASSYAIRDRSGQVPVYVSRQLWRDGKLAARLSAGGGIAEVIGFLAQRDSLPPYDGGYRLVPRVPADITFEPKPPVAAIAVVSILCLAGLLLLLSRRRRQSAERRALELQLLTDDLMRSEAALRETGERHRILFERNPWPMWVVDAESCAIIVVNDAAVAHYGFSRDEFLQLRVRDIQVAATARDPESSGRQAQFGTFNGGVQRHRTKDGSTILVETEINEVTLDGRAVQVLLMHDITARQSLEEQLRQTQKMDAVGQLAGGVAHDFNNLVTVIDAHAQFISDAIVEADPLQEDVAAIRKAVSRAAGLTRQLLAFSRKQIMRPRLVDLSAVVKDAQGMLRRLIGEDIIIETKLLPSPGVVLADVGQLEQILVNLAVNARDAMTGGGRLLIETGMAEFEALSVDEPAPVAPGRYVVLAVSDTGTGMDEATRKRVFEPFFTTKEVGKGTGLGLATVYGIVKQSGGYIWCFSERGRGTTFNVYLPLAADSAEAEAPSEAAAMPGSETILIVEDEEPLRSIARRVLVRQGYRVLDAASGADALRLAQEYDGHIDLVLMDMVMPGLSGRDTAERLRASGCSAQVLYMSGYTDDEILRRGLLLQPGLAFLEKPFTPNTLAQAVRAALEQVPARA